MAKRARKNGGGSTAVREADTGRTPRHGVVKTSGSGFHEPGSYGKADRRKAKTEIDQEVSSG